MTKLQNLFVALVNMDNFQMTLKFSLLLASVIYVETLWAHFCVKTCRMFADVCSVCTIWITIKLSLTFGKLKLAYGQAPDPWLS